MGEKPISCGKHDQRTVGNEAQAINIPITTVEVVGKIGPHHRDIDGKTSESIRGPFEIRDVKGNEVPTYPVLWAHDAKREQVMCFDGDSEGLPLKGATIEQQESIVPDAAQKKVPVAGSPLGNFGLEQRKARQK
jgi:hypothetical protein